MGSARRLGPYAATGCDASSTILASIPSPSDNGVHVGPLFVWGFATTSCAGGIAWFNRIQSGRAASLTSTRAGAAAIGIAVLACALAGCAHGGIA